MEFNQLIESIKETKHFLNFLGLGQEYNDVIEIYDF